LHTAVKGPSAPPPNPTPSWVSLVPPTRVPPEHCLSPWSATELPPDAPVMTTDALLVPDVEYVLVMDAPVPDKLSLPLQEYVYGVSPPDGYAVQVTGLPA